MRIDRRLPITLAGTILLVASGCAYIAGGVAAVALSGGGGGGGKGRSNTPPVVGVSTPDGAVNDLIAIDYQLVDLESDRVDLEVTYSVAGGAEQPATQAEGAGSSGTTGLATSPTQTSYVFVWNSLADLGNLNLVDVRLHLTPVETFGGVRGETAVTGPFEARNAYMATVAGGTVGADLNFPNGAAVDPGSLPGPSDDVIYIADSFNNRVLRYDSATASTTIHAGTGDPGYDGDFVMATEASLNIPLDVALDPAGDLIICDSGNGRIRLVERSTGFIRTIAGGGALAWPDIGDGGLASQAMLFLPAGIDVDAAGNVYVVDLAIHRLRVIARQPTPLVLGGVTIPPAFIDTIAGDGTGSPLAPKGDGGLATLAVLDTPEDVAVDGRGLIYVTQPVRNLVRIINPTLSAVTVAGVLVDPGNIETFAGVGLPGDLGDGGPPTGAWLDTPNGIAVDAADNVYITDQENHRLKVVNVGATPLAVGNTTVAAGTLRSVCGTGFINPFGDGGPADQAGLFYPTRTAIDPDGHVLVVEGGGNRLRVINTSSQIETWGATPIAPGAIDTVPVSLEERGTSFSFPARVVLDDEGNLYFNDLTDPNFGISVGNQIWRLEGATGALSVVAGDGR